MEIEELYNKGYSLRHIARLKGFKHCHTIKRRLIERDEKSEK